MNFVVRMKGQGLSYTAQIAATKHSAAHLDCRVATRDGSDKLLLAILQCRCTAGLVARFPPVDPPQKVLAPAHKELVRKLPAIWIGLPEALSTHVHIMQ